METAQPWGMPMPMFVASGSAKDSGWAAKHGGRKKTIMVISRCPWHWVKRRSKPSPDPQPDPNL